MYTVTREQQIKELADRVPPVVNVNIVIFKNWKFLVGRHSSIGHWLFPGKRMKFDETLHEVTERVMREEVPGVQARKKKLITVLEDHGNDSRSYNLNIFFLFDFISGNPIPNEQLVDFQWVDREEFSNLDRVYDSDKKAFNEIDLAVRTMNTTEDELLVEVDKDNHEIGSIVKRDAHTDPARYHRAAWMFIFNSQGEIILQQRGFNKAHNPGQWDMAGGHQISGNTIEQTAHQELKEELGIETDLVLRETGLYQDQWQSEYHYLYYGFHDGPYKFDPNEVVAVKEFDCNKLLNRGFDSQYSIINHVYECLEKLKDVWEPLTKK